MSKPKAPKPNLIVAQAADGSWRVELDRETKDYAAMITGVGYIGSEKTPSAAQTLCHEYLFRQLQQAAA